MHDATLIVGPVFLCVALVGIIIWSVLLQRKAVIRQKQALDVQGDAVERQKNVMTQVVESLVLSRKSVANQERMIALLEEIRDDLKKPS